MVEGILCSRCHKRHPPSKMKYLHDAKNMLCIDCLETIRKQQAKPEVKEVKEKTPKLRFKCKRCNHIFMLKPNFSKTCPYCASTNIAEQGWNSDLDNLIRDSTQRIYDN